MEKAKPSDSNSFSKNLYDYDGELDNFLVSFTVTDSDLTIQAESNLNSKLYQKKLTIDAVASASSGLFQTTQALYQGLVDAIDKKEKSARINITQDAKLMYDLEVTVGSQKIPFKFTIALDEQIIDEKTKLLKQIEKLTRKVIEQEKRIQKLEERNVDNDLPAIEFNPFSPNISAFGVSNLGRTIMRKTASSWRGMMAKSPLSKQQKSSFSVRIDHIDSNRNVMIGICPSNLTNNQYYYGYNGSLAYYGSANGTIWKNGAQNQVLQFSAAVLGAVIKVTTDLAKNEVTFYYNDTVVYTSPLDTSLTQSYDYFPFVDLSSTYDKVSFVSFKIQE